MRQLVDSRRGSGRAGLPSEASSGQGPPSHPAGPPASRLLACSPPGAPIPGDIPQGRNARQRAGVTPLHSPGVGPGRRCPGGQTPGHRQGPEGTAPGSDPHTPLRMACVLQTLSLGSLNLAPLPRSGFCPLLKTHAGTTCSVTPQAGKDCTVALLQRSGFFHPGLLLKPPHPPARALLLFPPSQDSGLALLVHTPWLSPLGPVAPLPHLPPHSLHPFAAAHLLSVSPPDRDVGRGRAARLSSPWKPGPCVGAQRGSAHKSDMPATLGPPEGTAWSPCFPSLGQEGEVVESTAPSSLGCPEAPKWTEELQKPLGLPAWIRGLQGGPRPPDTSQKHRPTCRPMCSVPVPEPTLRPGTRNGLWESRGGTPWEDCSALHPSWSGKQCVGVMPCTGPCVERGRVPLPPGRVCGFSLHLGQLPCEGYNLPSCGVSLG